MISRHLALLPTIGGFKPIGGFKHWAAKELPQ